jgi:hypothetical protein
VCVCVGLCLYVCVPQEKRIITGWFNFAWRSEREKEEEECSEREGGGERGREGEQESEREKFLLIIKKWLKVGKHNALSDNTASGRSGSSIWEGEREYNEKSKVCVCVREREREREVLLTIKKWGERAIEREREKKTKIWNPWYQRERGGGGREGGKEREREREVEQNKISKSMIPEREREREAN